jgi:putative membrane protein
MTNSNLDTDRLSSIKTEILVAFIFSIIFIIIWLVAGISEISAYLAFIAALGPYYTAVGIIDAGALVAGIIFFIFIIPSILVFIRIYRQYTAVNRNDVPTLKRLNSIGWAIIALIFGGVIPGIMLLVAHEPIEQLSVAPQKRDKQMVDLDRLAKLKTMMDSGVITKEEFEQQKNLLLHPSNTPAQTESALEGQLRKLKSLYDSGAINKAEYDQQREAFLREI